MIRRLVIWGLGLLLGLFLVFGLYDWIVTATALNSYEETFQGLGHPQDTTLIDAFKFKFNYSPATYRDESIQNRCVYLVGEVRSHSSEWDELKAFYDGKTLSHGDTGEIYVGVFPIQFVSEEGASPLLDLDSAFSYSPFEVDVMAKLESHYYFLGFPKGLGESGKEMYVVYIAPDCK